MGDVAAYHVFVCALFPVQGGMWTAFHIPPCTWNNADRVAYGSSLLGFGPR